MPYHPAREVTISRVGLCPLPPYGSIGFVETFGRNMQMAKVERSPSGAETENLPHIPPMGIELVEEGAVLQGIRRFLQHFRALDAALALFGCHDSRCGISFIRRKK